MQFQREYFAIEMVQETQYSYPHYKEAIRCFTHPKFSTYRSFFIYTNFNKLL